MNRLNEGEKPLRGFYWFYISDLYGPIRIRFLEMNFVDWNKIGPNNSKWKFDSHSKELPAYGQRSDSASIFQ